MNKNKFVKFIKGKLIVSCQAVDKEPLNDTKTITLMAKAVIEGGATVLRLSQYDHIKSIHNTFKNIPIIGLIKNKYKNSEVFITPTKKEIDQLLELGIDCIAFDATNRKRPCKESVADLVKYIRSKNKEVTIMADCASYDDIIRCNKLDFDVIGTTLRGHTKDTEGMSNVQNKYEFIKKIVKVSKKPIIAEGGVWLPKEVKDLLKLGSHSVVVGSAITRPKDITMKFMKEIYANK